MRATINTAEQKPIDWNARDMDRVIQNVCNLLQLVRYEVAFNRTLGLPPELIDRPTALMVQQYQAELVDLIEENEPRATVDSVECIGVAETGQIIFEVVVDIVD